MKDVSWISLSVVILLTGCTALFRPDAEFYETAAGGYRVKDPNVFEYNTPHYRSLNKSPLDTTAIYVLDSLYDPYRDGIKELKVNATRFMRFFSEGQVVIGNSDSLSSRIIDNRDVGTPGYFFVEDNKLRMDIFQNLNGGQTGKYFGVINTAGNLVMYEQRPETESESFKELEKFGKKTVWKKVHVEGMTPYKPSW